MTSERLDWFGRVWKVDEKGIDKHNVGRRTRLLMWHTPDRETERIGDGSNGCRQIDKPRKKKKIYL